MRTQICILLDLLMLIIPVAHRTLVNDRHVLHRDISQNNILLGRRGSRAGQRGILVDFDMAVHGERPLCQAPTDFKAVSYTDMVLKFTG